MDFEGGAVAVRQTLIPVGGRWLFQEPKTKRSRRNIALSPTVLSVLKRHNIDQKKERLMCGPAYKDNGLVFCTAVGTPLGPRNLTRQYERLVAKAGVPRITFHALRHTCASLMLAGGEHPKIVSERLGHSTVGITLDIYSHTIPGLQQEAAGRLDERLFGANGTKPGR